VSTHLAVVLREPPVGELTPESFEVVDRPTPEPGPGEVLVEVSELSLDPYLRATLVGRHLGDAAVPVGGTVPGRAVARVVRSQADQLTEGTWVLAETGWQERAVVRAETAKVVTVPDGIPRSAVLGALGMPGLTAYAALRRHVQPAPGDTVVVSSATGGVGAVAGQLARIAGARTVAIVGDEQKQETALSVLGYDEAVIRGRDGWEEQLAAACPARIHGYVHMGDAPTLGVVAEMLAIGARVSLVGIQDSYGDGPRTMLRAGAVMSARASVHGMVVFDHLDLEREQTTRIGRFLQEGRMVLHEDRTTGLASAPEAFVRLMAGRNQGKVVVEVS
jgi:NADPH-dependent curcumin reductase CurA